MTKDTEPPANLDATKRENALIGYQMAISLWAYQGEQRWARFNIMLFINSVILGGIGWAFTSQPCFPIVRLLLPFAGFFLCTIWLAFDQREAAYSDYYLMSARELEEQYLSNSVHTVARGGLFADGQPVTLQIDGKPPLRRMGWWARRLRAKTAAKIVICSLGLVYVVLCCYTVLHEAKSLF